MPVEAEESVWVSDNPNSRVFRGWNTVHRYHVTWSRDGTWEAVVDRLRALVREREGRDPEPSAGIVDARSVRGAATVTGDTRGYDAGKKISGRKAFGVVDTLGLLMAVVVMAASASDNTGGTRVVELAAPKSGRLAKIWHDTGFKRTFSQFCRRHKSKPNSCPAAMRTPSKCSHGGGWLNGPGAGWSITGGSSSTMNATRS